MFVSHHHEWDFVFFNITYKRMGLLAESRLAGQSQARADVTTRDKTD